MSSVEIKTSGEPGGVKGGGVQPLKIGPKNVDAKKQEPLHAKKPEQAKLNNAASSDGSIMTRNYKEDTFLLQHLKMCL